MKAEFIRKLAGEREIREILEEEVEEWFFSAFDSFTPPQRAVVKEIHRGKSVLICAPTGSGKTLSAFLAGINELVKLDKAGKLEDTVYILYISPLRALNNDIKRNLEGPLEGIARIFMEKHGRRPGIRIGVRTSDTTQSERAKQLRKPPHILITTPESLAIILSSPKFSQKLENVKYVIVDEIHALAENKRGVHLSLSLERLQARAGRRMRRIGLSATIRPLEEVAMFLTGGRKCRIADVEYIKEKEMEVISPSEDLIYEDSSVLSEKLYAEIEKIIGKHRSVLVFTNTRSGTERVVHHLRQRGIEAYAHHSSLSRDVRLDVEERLKRGEIRVVVSSTSLELGIDIGYIDAVILIGSPKSISRALQRIGRSGHRLHEKSIGYFIALSREDLLEVSVLARNALKGKIDRIRIPRNCLDVLSQHIVGMCLERKWSIGEMFKVVRKAWPFRNLSKEDFESVLKYLSGGYGLEDMKVYAKIWVDGGMAGKRGRMTRPIYYMNSGTIPDETGVDVYHGKKRIGRLEEGFAERLEKGDVFVLAGKSYRVEKARGNRIYVSPTGERPTIPAWFSEMLPLSYDLASDIRRELWLIGKRGAKKSGFPADERALKAIEQYVEEQKAVSILPKPNELLVEHFSDEKERYFFHAIAGRRANDALSRVVALRLTRKLGTNIGISISDYGFMLTLPKGVRIPEKEMLSALSTGRFREDLRASLAGTSLAKRKFREIAAASFLIIRRYMGREKSVKRQQIRAEALLESLGDDFPVVKELYRHIMEDYMSIDDALSFLASVKRAKIREMDVVSPMAMHLYTQGLSDVVLMEDRRKMVMELHRKIMEKIGGLGNES